MSQVRALYLPPEYAGVAQLVEQLICNQQVAGSSPITSSKQGHNPCPSYMGEFPSGQRGQTVNLLLLASMVRIHPLPPRRSKVRFAPFFFTEKHPPASLLLLFRKKNYEVLREPNSTFWLVSIKKNTTALYRLTLFFAKRHARLTCSLTSSLTTVHSHYHLFVIMRLRRILFHSPTLIIKAHQCVLLFCAQNLLRRTDLFHRERKNPISRRAPSNII